MIIKKKTITQVLVMENLIKNLKNGALSRYLIKNKKKKLYQKLYQES